MACAVVKRVLRQKCTCSLTIAESTTSSSDIYVGRLDNFVEDFPHHLGLRFELGFHVLKLLVKFIANVHQLLGHRRNPWVVALLRRPARSCGQRSFITTHLMCQRRSTLLQMLGMVTSCVLRTACLATRLEPLDLNQSPKTSPPLAAQQHPFLQPCWQTPM